MIAVKTPCVRNLQGSTNSHWFCCLPNLKAVLVIAGKIQENRNGFPGRFKGAGGKSKSPGSFPFGEAKENAVPQLHISNMSSSIVKCIIDQNRPAAAGIPGRRVFRSIHTRSPRPSRGALRIPPGASVRCAVRRGLVRGRRRRGRTHDGFLPARTFLRPRRRSC